MGYNEADSSLYRKKYLYSLVAQKLEVQEPGETQLLNNLHQVLLESNLAKMVGIEKHISAKEFGQALALNESLICNNLSETVSKEVYGIWLNTWAKDVFEFTEAEQNTLLSYALLTPYYGGEAVYLARIMMDLDIDDFGIEYRRTEETEEEVTEVQIPWELYASEGKLYVKPQKTVQELRLCDLSGRQVFKQQQELPLGGQSVLTLPALPNGLYLCKLFNANGQALYSHKIMLNL